MGNAVKLAGKGISTSKVNEPVLTPDQCATLEIEQAAGRFLLLASGCFRIVSRFIAVLISFSLGRL
jgi:hypothetical protein